MFFHHAAIWVINILKSQKVFFAANLYSVKGDKVCICVMGLKNCAGRQKRQMVYKNDFTDTFLNNITFRTINLSNST
jgi:hypothetical protein